MIHHHILLWVVFSLPAPERATFEVEITTNTEVAIYLDGHRLEPGTKYRTQAFYGAKCLELEVRFINGLEIIKKTFFLDIEAGYHSKFRLSIIANPPTVVCS